MADRQQTNVQDKLRGEEVVRKAESSTLKHFEAAKAFSLRESAMVNLLTKQKADAKKATIAAASASKAYKREEVKVAQAVRNEANVNLARDLQADAAEKARRKVSVRKEKVNRSEDAAKKAKWSSKVANEKFQNGIKRLASFKSDARSTLAAAVSKTKATFASKIGKAKKWIQGVVKETKEELDSDVKATSESEKEVSEATVKYHKLLHVSSRAEQKAVQEEAKLSQLRLVRKDASDAAKTAEEAYRKASAKFEDAETVLKQNEEKSEEDTKKLQATKKGTLSDIETQMKSKTGTTPSSWSARMKTAFKTSTALGKAGAATATALSALKSWGAKKARAAAEERKTEATKGAIIASVKESQRKLSDMLRKAADTKGAA